MRTEVVNIRRDRLFGMHADDVYVGRAGRGLSGYFGNPVRVGHECPECGRLHSAPGDTLPCYERYLDRRLATDAEFRRRVARLRGKRLGCFCKPDSCHGDLLAARAEQLPPRVVTVDFRGVVDSRLSTFAKLIGVDLADGRWVELGDGARGFIPRRRVVRVNFQSAPLPKDPCRCRTGKRAQCRECFSGVLDRCSCGPCLARWREIGVDPYEDDDYPSEIEVLGVVGDR